MERFQRRLQFPADYYLRVKNQAVHAAYRDGGRLNLVIFQIYTRPKYN